MFSAHFRSRRKTSKSIRRRAIILLQTGKIASIEVWEGKELLTGRREKHLHTLKQNCEFWQSMEGE